MGFSADLRFYLHASDDERTIANQPVIVNSLTGTEHGGRLYAGASIQDSLGERLVANEALQ